MDPQLAFFYSFLITEGIALACAFALWRPMRALLLQPAAMENRSRFWQCYCGITLTLIPSAALLLAQPTRRADSSLALAVINQLCWPITSLAVALLIIGFLIALVTAGKTVSISISHEQADDLNRLLSKVEEIRARHILRRVEDPEERSA